MGWRGRLFFVCLLLGAQFWGAQMWQPAPASAHQASLGPLTVPLPSLDGNNGGGTGGRPEAPADPRRPADRVSPPAVLVRPALVSATATVGGQAAPLVVPQSALPWRFRIEQGLATRYGERAVFDAVRQWDGVPGSRWATLYDGLAPAGTRNVEDARSVFFLEASCPTGTAGYTYWQLGAAAADSRYGQTGVYLTEVDVGICPSVRSDALRLAIAHEVGHAFGLQHLCDEGQPCWQREMGSSTHRCRVMYAYASSCPRSISSQEHRGPVHVYPRLQRLAGPSRVETAARASFASFPASSAQTVVLARADQTAHGPLAAAPLASVLRAPMLLGLPDAKSCLEGTAAEELSRVAAERARVVLVGDWPVQCTATFSGWGLRVDRATGTDPAALSTAVAKQLAASSQMGDTAFLVSSAADASGHVADGVAGGAAAGSLGGPVLFSSAERLSEPVRRWLEEHRQVRRVYVLGGSATFSDAVVVAVQQLGLDVVRIAGADRVATALALADHPSLFGSNARTVVVAASGAWADAVTAAAIGARLDAPVLLSPAQPHPDVARWLMQHADGGYVVGGRGQLPYELQWAYSTDMDS